VGPVGAVGGVAAGAHVGHAEDVGNLQVLFEGVQVALGQRPGRRDESVVALGAQAVVLEPAAQQPGALDGAQVGAAGGVGVLGVAGELDLAVTVAGEFFEDLAEAGGQIGGERVAAGGVPDGVEDDAALVGGDEHLTAVAVALAVAVASLVVLGGEGRGGAEDGGGDGGAGGCGAGGQEAAAADAEPASEGLVGAGGGCRAGDWDVVLRRVREVTHGCLPSSSLLPPVAPAAGRCQCRVFHSQ